jgi:hypothetical protein
MIMKVFLRNKILGDISVEYLDSISGNIWAVFLEEFEGDHWRNIWAVFLKTK